MKKLITKMLAVLLTVSSINIQADVSTAQTVGQAACALSNNKSNLCAILGGSVGGVGGLVITIVGILKFVPVDKIGSFLKSLKNVASKNKLSVNDQALYNAIKDIYQQYETLARDGNRADMSKIIDNVLTKYKVRENLTSDVNIIITQKDLNTFVDQATNNSHLRDRIALSLGDPDKFINSFKNEIVIANILADLKSTGKITNLQLDNLYKELPIGQQYTPKAFLEKIITIEPTLKTSINEYAGKENILLDSAFHEVVHTSGVPMHDASGYHEAFV